MHQYIISIVCMLVMLLAIFMLWRQQRDLGTKLTDLEVRMALPNPREITESERCTVSELFGPNSPVPNYNTDNAVTN